MGYMGYMGYMVPVVPAGLPWPRRADGSGPGGAAGLHVGVVGCEMAAGVDSTGSWQGWCLNQCTFGLLRGICEPCGYCWRAEPPQSGTLLAGQQVYDASPGKKAGVVY